MADQINLKGMDKAAVLAALYNAAKPQGMGFLHYDPEPMSVDEARELLDGGNLDFDYLKGRVMKVDLSGDILDPQWYDRDNGGGAAQGAIESLLITHDPSNITIRAHHVEATRESAEITTNAMREKTSFSTEGKAVVLKLGLSDVADVLRPKVEEAERSLESPLE